ncbi:hypothetical protein [Microcella alkaliphila]|uniref:Plasmid partitioning protein n=1 Tax=Microcella alkaliphila TaxID=279828 RepID=A0A0U5B9U3_9MICO|nr:hypothetical protein [Microcella alkaliphila]BAU32585.1 plasmid partitioning protein [Microcella alkaliphila]
MSERRDDPAERGEEAHDAGFASDDLEHPDDLEDGEQNVDGAYRDGMLGGGAIGGAIGAAANDAATGVPVRDDERRDEQEGRR